MNVMANYLGVKLVDGKIRPRKGSRHLGAVICIAFMLFFIFMFVCTIFDKDYGYTFCAVFGFITFLYILCLTPTMTWNVVVEFKNFNGAIAMLVTHRGKFVDIAYKFDKQGKIAFARNESKLSCIKYMDGSRMGVTTKYRIINYLTHTLMSNNLVSNEVTITFE